MTTDNARDDHPIPWKIDGEIYEGDGAAGVNISDANNQSVVVANSWSLFDRGEPRNATERDWSIARKVVEAVNGFHPWISVNDRLPTSLGAHLVYCGRDPISRPIYFLAIWDSANGVWRCDDGGIIATVRRWCEITDPEDDQ